MSSGSYVIISGEKKSFGYQWEKPQMGEMELWDIELVEISFSTLKSSKWEIVHSGPEGVNC